MAYPPMGNGGRIETTRDQKRGNGSFVHDSREVWGPLNMRNYWRNGWRTDCPYVAGTVRGLAVSIMVRRCAILTLLAGIALTVSCNSSGNGSHSTQPPRPPHGLIVRVVDEGVRLTWDAVPGATMYSVFWGDNDHTYSGFFLAESNHFTLGGLEKGELYTFSVTAWNSVGESDYSKPNSLVYDDDPSKAPHYVSLGDRLMSQGRYGEAQAYLTAAIRLDPFNPVAYRRRAQLYQRTNQEERARQDRNRAETILKDKPLSQDLEDATRSRLASK